MTCSTIPPPMKKTMLAPRLAITGCSPDLGQEDGEGENGAQVEGQGRAVGHSLAKAPSGVEGGGIG